MLNWIFFGTTMPMNIKVICTLAVLALSACAQSGPRMPSPDMDAGTGAAAGPSAPWRGASEGPILYGP